MTKGQDFISTAKLEILTLTAHLDIVNPSRQVDVALPHEVCECENYASAKIRDVLRQAWEHAKLDQYKASLTA